MKEMTLCVLFDDSRILLAMKKRGFGAGRWNGFGGKLHEGETPERAAIRETQEEIGIAASALDVLGTFVFHLPGKELMVHVFRITAYDGDPTETEEMRPEWFAHADIPYDSMWPDDRLWLPRVLAGERLDGEFWFSDEDTIEKYVLTPR